MPTNESISMLCLIISMCWQALPCNEPVLTLEDHEKLDGKKFCTIGAKGGDLANLCNKKAEIERFDRYNHISHNGYCEKKNISLYSENTHKQEVTNEVLLFCVYNETGVETLNGKPARSVAELRTRVFGRGKGKDDVMEYKIRNRVAYPDANLEGFFNGVLFVILSLEEYKNLEGDDFCSTLANGDSFETLCTKIAEINQITGYISITRYDSCDYKDISLYSRDNGKWTTIKEKLLNCEYNRKEEVTGNMTLLHRISLGRGKEERDVMEYDVDNDGDAHPMANRVRLLNEVSLAITFGEHVNRQGEDFCSTQVNMDYFRLLCNKIAKIEKIPTYDTLIGEIACRRTNIALYLKSENGGWMVYENLLRCEYKMWHPTLAIKGERYTMMDERALGRGKGVNDVMVYDIDSKGHAHPLANLKDLLTEVPQAITFEELNDRQGEVVCTKDAKNSDLEKFCAKTAKIDEIPGYSSMTCVCAMYDISSYSKNGGKEKLIKDNLLQCDYNDNGDRRVLGRGIGQKDIIEYEIDFKGIAHPLINREGFLTKIENQKIDEE